MAPHAYTPLLHAVKTGHPRLYASHMVACLRCKDTEYYLSVKMGIYNRNS